MQESVLVYYRPLESKNLDEIAEKCISVILTGDLFYDINHKETPSIPASSSETICKLFDETELIKIYITKLLDEFIHFPRILEATPCGEDDEDDDTELSWKFISVYQRDLIVNRIETLVKQATLAPNSDIYIIYLRDKQMRMTRVFREIFLEAIEEYKQVNHVEYV